MLKFNIIIFSLLLGFNILLQWTSPGILCKLHPSYDLYKKAKRVLFFLNSFTLGSLTLDTLEQMFFIFKFKKIKKRC